MKLILMTIMMLSFGLLTACGSSGGGGDPKVDPVPVVPNDLEILDPVITSDANENQLIALVIPEYKDSNTYAFTGVDGNNVKLSSENGSVVFKVEADFETQPVYNFIMTVTNEAEQTKDIDVTINIIDVLEDLNSLPSVINESVNENSRFAFTIPEYKATNSYAFAGVDGDSVKLWAERGEVIFHYAPDFETQESYNFIMTVTNEIEQTKDIDVTLNINDVSDAFIFEVLAGSIGSLHLKLNPGDTNNFENYSFTIKKDDEAERLVELTGVTHNQLELIKPLNDDGDDVPLQRYSITPKSEGGLPSFTLFPNTRAVNVRVIQWGDNSWESLYEMFKVICNSNSSSLTFSDQKNSPNLSKVVNMNGVLFSCDFSTSLNYWDVSKVTNMEESFESTLVTADLSQWDVSSVTNMTRMFYNTQNFNSDLSLWNVSSVKNMDLMFLLAKEFNGDLSLWDVSSVENMRGMFSLTEKFNRDISNWDVTNVKNMDAMFDSTLAFNGDISLWEPLLVESMLGMFYEAQEFDKDLSEWNVDAVTNCAWFKEGALVLTDAHTPNFQSCDPAAAP